MGTGFRLVWDEGRNRFLFARSSGRRLYRKKVPAAWFGFRWRTLDKKCRFRLIPRIGGNVLPVQWNWPEAETGNEWDSPNEGMTDLNFPFVISAGQTVAVTIGFQ